MSLKKNFRSVLQRCHMTLLVGLIDLCSRFRTPAQDRHPGGIAARHTVLAPRWKRGDKREQLSVT